MNNKWKENIPIIRSISFPFTICHEIFLSLNWKQIIINIYNRENEFLFRSFGKVMNIQLLKEDNN